MLYDARSSSQCSVTNLERWNGGGGREGDGREVPKGGDICIPVANKFKKQYFKRIILANKYKKEYCHFV